MNGFSATLLAAGLGCKGARQWDQGSEGARLWDGGSRRVLQKICISV